MNATTRVLNTVLGQDPLEELGRLIGQSQERQLFPDGRHALKPLESLLHIAERTFSGLSTKFARRPLRGAAELFDNALRRKAQGSVFDYIPRFEDAFFERPDFRDWGFRSRRATRIIEDRVRRGN
jgi:hypothetical protein